MVDPVVAKVRHVAPESARFVGVVLEVAPEVAAQNHKPGQYIVVRGDGSPTFLAVSSPPGEHAALELLLGPPAVAALRPEVGAEWRIDPPAGPGFPVERARGRDALLFGVGSAVGPLRALLEAMRNERAEHGRIVLYAGARHPDDHVYRRWEPSWRADGIEVRRAVSRPFVQDLVELDAPSLTHTEAFVCGHSEMVQGVKERLISLGLDAAHIHQNY